MIREASRSDKFWIIDLLTKSFDTNGSVNFVIKQDKNRIKRIRLLMEYSFEKCFMFGKVLVTENKEAAALILFPEKKKNTLKNLMLDLRLTISCIGINRILKILNREKAIKENYPSEPICYLWFLGVEPFAQGSGIGTLLLKEIIKLSEEMKRPVYLETSMTVNLPFYIRQKFEIYKELKQPHTLFLMRRISF